MNSRYRRQALVLAGAVAIPAAASARSSPGSASAGGGGTSAGSPASSGPALTKSPIVIGVMSEQSGPAASADKYPQPVAKAWASWINDNGGINGHPVQIEYGDSQGNPGTGRAQVQQLISDKVVALVGVADSTDAAWVPIVEKAGIPVIGGSGATVTPQDVKDAMYALPATNLGGLLPQTVKYTPNEATRPFTCSWIITLDNGKYSSDGLKTTCASGG